MIKAEVIELIKTTCPDGCEGCNACEDEIIKPTDNFALSFIKAIKRRTRSNQPVFYVKLSELLKDKLLELLGEIGYNKEFYTLDFIAAVSRKNWKIDELAVNRLKNICKKYEKRLYELLGETEYKKFAEKVSVKASKAVVRSSLKEIRDGIKTLDTDTICERLGVLPDDDTTVITNEEILSTIFTELLKTK